MGESLGARGVREDVGEFGLQEGLRRVALKCRLNKRCSSQ